MKKSTLFLLCTIFFLSLIVVLASCNIQPGANESPIPDVSVTVDLTKPETDGSIGVESLDPDDAKYDPAHYVVIRTAEDLMAFHKAVNEAGEQFLGMTVVFLDDVDMSGYTWTSLDGTALKGVTFEGFGHTICNLRFADYEYETQEDVVFSDKGCGFIGAACGDLTFRNLTLLNTVVTAYDGSVGNFVGSLKNGRAEFVNCRSAGFTADGWLDYGNQDIDNGGHAIALRMAGFIGHMGKNSTVAFRNCHVESIRLSGFKDLAAFVGYDEAGTLDAPCFSGCTVKNAEFTFSYCLAENYSVDMPRKFVSVFFNGKNWVDRIDQCVEMGNSYEEVRFYDWSDNSTEYTPANFRSWTSEDTAESNT